MLKRYLFKFYRRISGLNFWFRRRFTAAGFLVLWGIIVSGVIWLDTNFTLGYQIFWFLVCLTGVSVILGLLSRGRFSAVRQLPRFGTAGVPFQYVTTLMNGTSRAQRNLRIAEIEPDPRPTLSQFLHTPEPGEGRRNWFDRLGGHYRWRWLIAKNRRFESSTVDVASVSASSSAVLEQSIVPKRRGSLQLPALSVSWSDPFGLFNSRCVVHCAQSLLILPKRYPVSPLNLPGTVRYQ